MVFRAHSADDMAKFGAMNTVQKIAFLVLGSLMWDRRTLPIVGEWMTDGPVLPIEFARFQGGRIA